MVGHKHELEVQMLKVRNWKTHDLQKPKDQTMFGIKKQNQKL